MYKNIVHGCYMYIFIDFIMIVFNSALKFITRMADQPGAVAGQN